MRLARIGLLAVFANAVVSAQTADEQQPTFRSGVDVIEIDVGVIDGDGRPITDLKATEFTVAIDGEPRPVVQAQFISLRPDGPDARREPESRDVFYTSNTADTRGRLITIAIDQQNILFGEGRHVMRAVGAFLDTLGPSDRVALLAVPQPGPYVDFTSNFDLVRREVEGMAGHGRRVRGQLNIGLHEAFSIAEYGDQRMEAEVIARVCGGDLGCALFQVPGESREIVREVRSNGADSLRALESVLEALGDVDGPKALVWISGGLVLGLDTAALRNIEHLAAASRTTLYVLMLDEPLADVSEAAAQPTPREDRRMKEEGLQALAAMTRGALFRTHDNPGPVLDRLEAELSGYYLLGVAARPTDRDQDQHAITVSVGRRGAHVRARRQFRFTPEPAADDSVDARLARMLRSPVPTRELPLRVATYAYQDAGSGQVRVMIAAEIDGNVGASDLTLAYRLLDREGKIVSSDRQQVTATPANTPRGTILEYSLDTLVAPGIYTLRFAVVDAADRRGSVEHSVSAWQPSDGPLAVGDLMVTDSLSASSGFHPQVEARVASGSLAVYTELYADSSSILEQTEVQFDVVEVAEGESGPTHGSAAAVPGGPNKTIRHAVSAEVPVDHLPPGRYVARARVLRNSEEVARLYRPFQITESP